MFDILKWKKNKPSRTNQWGREFDELVGRFEPPGYFRPPALFDAGKWDPTIDVSEGRKDVTVKAEIPGLEANDFDISIDGRLLTIRGEKRREEKKEEETYYRIERSYGYFKRTIELPAEVEPNQVDATYKRGILSIKLRKTKTSETKRIKVVSG